SAKLVVVGGPNAGREFRLATPIAKVGRDPQFSDFPLHDKFTSNPHFSIISEQSQFFIQDEGSTNGTKLNGQPIPKQQRVPLPPDSIIEAGQSRIQFKRLGGPTRRLSGSSAPRSPQPPPAKTEYAPPASPQQQGSQEPTQPWRPNGQ
ncbi:MAG: FHA domain-containing protein, partial [Anaerolineae bacterium]